MASSAGQNSLFTILEGSVFAGPLLSISRKTGTGCETFGVKRVR
jgi:hypothetical protein